MPVSHQGFRLLINSLVCVSLKFSTQEVLPPNTDGPSTIHHLDIQVVHIINCHIILQLSNHYYISYIIFHTQDRVG
jgi:hypothetical protein